MRRVSDELSDASPPDRSARTAHVTISPPNASTAGSIARSEPPVVRMSSTSSTRSRGAIVNPRRNSRRTAPSASFTSSAKIPRTPSWRAVSNARTMPPVVGPATTSTSGSPPAPRCCAAQKPHNSLVAAGSCRTRNFSRYRSECLPLLSRKWPSLRAPERRKSSSVLDAIAAAAASSAAGRIVVMSFSFGAWPRFVLRRSTRRGSPPSHRMLRAAARRRSAPSRPVLHALGRGHPRPLGEGGPDQRPIRVEPAPQALGPKLFAESDR